MKTDIRTALGLSAGLTAMMAIMTMMMTMTMMTTTMTKMMITRQLTKNTMITGITKIPIIWREVIWELLRMPEAAPRWSTVRGARALQG